MSPVSIPALQPPCSVPHPTSLPSVRSTRSKANTLPSPEGAFYAQVSRVKQCFRHSAFDLPSWQRKFYAGERLKAEIELYGAWLNQDCSHDEMNTGCALLHASHGASVAGSVLSPFQQFQDSLPEVHLPAESRNQFLLAADCPDALLFWFLTRHLPTKGQIGGAQRLLALKRIALLLLNRFPKRPDLVYQL